MTNKDKFAFENKFINSKFKISKNFLYYIIAPLIFILVGIILLCTIGFNAGADFTGGSTFKLYVNNYGSSLNENTKQYDLDNKKDYSTVYNKIKTVLNENGLTIVSYRRSTINIIDYDVFEGQAVEVVYRNKATGNKISDENDSIRNQLLTEFNYNNYDLAISTVDQTVGHSAFNYSMEIMGAIVVGLALVIIYMLLRKMRGALFMMIIQVALDVMLSLALFIICRPVVNLSIGIAILSAFIISVLNGFVFLDKIKNGLKAGKYEGLNNNEIADKTTKSIFIKKSMLYILLLIVAILFASLSTRGVRDVALAMLLVLIESFYTSTFLMPAFWATTYRAKKTSKDKNSTKAVRA